MATSNASSGARAGLPAIVPAIVISLVIGGVFGFYARAATERPSSGPTSGPAAGAPGAGGGGGGRPGGGMMGAAALPRLVRNLATIQAVQNKGLTPEQAKALLPILQSLQSSETIKETDAQAQAGKIEGILNADQKGALQSLAPRAGGFGGGPGGGPGGMMGGGPGGMMGGAPGGAPMAGTPGAGGPGGGPGGRRAESDKPFANERNKKALDDLVAAVKAIAR